MSLARTAIVASLIVASLFVEAAVGESVPSVNEPSERTVSDDGNVKAQMRFLGVFDAGHKDVSIYKMLDASDDVICYLLMPDHASKQMVQDKLMYEGNSVGSISCVKGK